MRKLVRNVVQDLSEKKVYDTVNLWVATLDSDPTKNLQVSNTGRVRSLCDITQDVTGQARVGDKITIVGVEISLSIQLPGEVTAATWKENFILRVILFSWKDDSIYGPQVSDILETSLWTSDPVNLPVISPYNYDKEVKYEIMVDKRYCCSWQNGGSLIGSGTNTIDRPNVFDEYRFFDMELDVNYEQGTYIGLNKLYVLMISNAEVTTLESNTWDIRWISRLYYVDP